MRSSEIPRVCAVPNCPHDHDGDDEPIFMHGRCHPDAPTQTFLVGDVATVVCAVCEAVIVKLDLVP